MDSSGLKILKQILAPPSQDIREKEFQPIHDCMEQQHLDTIPLRMQKFSNCYCVL